MFAERSSAREESTDAELGLGPQCARGDDCPGWRATQINATVHHPVTGECPRCYVSSLLAYVEELARTVPETDDAGWTRIHTLLDLLGTDLDCLADQLETAWLGEQMRRRLSQPAQVRHLETITAAMEVVSGARR